MGPGRRHRGGAPAAGGRRPGAGRDRQGPAALDVPGISGFIDHVAYYWVAVKESYLSYHDMDIWQIVNSMVLEL